MPRMSPLLRASNEGLLRPRVARAQGTHRVIPPLLVEGERNRSKGEHKHGKCNPPDSDPLSAQRYVKIAHWRMPETPESCHEGPEPPAGPSDESQCDEDRHDGKGDGTLA